jgi:CheY-like chemotaxis protein
MAFIQPLHVLLVEDEEADQHLTMRSLRRLHAAIEVHIVASVKAARNFLRREGAFQEVERPACIILDMQLADGSGEALLDWMAEKDGLADIPVIVLSQAPSEPPHRNVVCEIRKPKSLSGYAQLEEGLGAILFAAADGARVSANDNFTTGTAQVSIDIE